MQSSLCTLWYSEKRGVECSTDLWEVAAEAGGPAALGAGTHAADVLLAQDLVAALGVGAPGQVGAALHVTPEHRVLILQGDGNRTDAGLPKQECNSSP